jgi:hypothetical protein
VALEIRNGRSGYGTLPAGASKIDRYASQGEEHTKVWARFQIRLLILLTTLFIRPELPNHPDLRTADSRYNGWPIGRQGNVVRGGCPYNPRKPKPLTDLKKKATVTLVNLGGLMDGPSAATKVLLVDDDEVVRSTLSNVLELSGFKVNQCSHCTGSSTVYLFRYIRRFAD